MNSYAIFSGLKFKTTSYNHEGEPFFLAITLYYGSINESRKLMDDQSEDNQAPNNGGSGEESKDGQGKDDGKVIEQTNGTTLPPPGIPRVLITKISPAIYINSRKLAKENNNNKKYHTVIEPFDIQTVEQDFFIRSTKHHHRVGQVHLSASDVGGSQTGGNMVNYQ